ncbi:TPA: tyrosine-type recombinase/integrase [Enterococcus faecium]
MPKLSNIHQDKNGKWYYSASLGFDEITGERIRKLKRGFPTQKLAKQAYDELMNDYSKSAITRNSTMSYKEFFDTYFEPHYKQRVTQRTYDNRISTMRIHFKFFYRMKLTEISAVKCQKWQNKLTNEYSNQYARNIYGLFQSSLDLAVKLGLIARNIAKEVGNVKKVKKKVDFWTIEEFQKVISSFDLKEYYEYYSFIMIWILFMTGIRFGEMQALTWKDIDFSEKTLEVSKSMYYKNIHEFYITEPKTSASNRTIALDDDTIHYLKEWKKIQDEHGGSEYVISYDGLPTNKHAPKHIIDKKTKLVGVHRIKTHALRHSHASMLISLGESALIVRDRLGHEDIKTTLGTYGHLYPNVNKAVAQKLTGLVKRKVNEEIIEKTPKFTGNQYLKRKGSKEHGKNVSTKRLGF